MKNNAACCSTPSIVTVDDSSTVCSNCGVVAGECSLLSGADAEYIENGSLHNVMMNNRNANTNDHTNMAYKSTLTYGFKVGKWSNGDEQLSHLFGVLKGVLQGLQLPMSLKDQTMAYFSLVAERLELTLGPKAKTCLSVCLYIVLQQCRIVRTLSEVLFQFNICIDRFSAIYFKITGILAVQLPEADIRIFLPRLCLAVYPLDLANRTRLESLASTVLNIAKHAWLDVGRKESSIQASTILAAYEAMKSNSCSLRIVNLVSSAAGCNPNLAKLRLREFKQHILKYAHHMPYFSHVTKFNLHKYLIDILDKASDIIQVIDHPISEDGTQRIQECTNTHTAISSIHTSTVQDVSVMDSTLHVSNPQTLECLDALSNETSTTQADLTCANASCSSPSTRFKLDPQCDTEQTAIVSRGSRKRTAEDLGPPSYIKAVHQRANMTDRIERAKRRMLMQPDRDSEQMDSCVDQVDQLIEVLLKEGVLEADILNYPVKRNSIGMMTMGGRDLGSFKE
ncbi:hypothetical protein BDV3_006697 [Batrachochytrium dendrobatidis]|uniref:Uncharacterized protein n=1 Tax=Batrachochytrium dendrobatidis (strain JEL423) TaxID=403673 RepID=A0A177WR24_BATDL|nr:hypothetical protein QVD99_007290 [Batrachochytrium dendrobatidis]OAJ42569.1 hypothetical protein BDEG_26017 [Batrachochytrium dendrobatidis JEL423]